MKQLPSSGNARVPALAALLTVVILGLFGAAIGWFMGSSNPVTPAGYVGYLTQGAVFGRTRFVALQNGPTSPGRAWLLDVVNVSITPYTFSEEFTGTSSVLSRDNLKIAFAVHIVWKIQPEKVKEFVERFSTLYGKNEHSDAIVKDAYDNFLKEPLRTFARDEVQQLDGLLVKDDIKAIGQRIQERLLKLASDTPFQISSVVVGNIQYPQSVADAVAQKLASTQELLRKEIEISIAMKGKEIRVVEAQGIAESMNVINEKLTALYVQHEAIEAQKAMVGSPNHSTIYIPVGPMGVPIVNTIGTPDTTTPGASAPGAPSAQVRPATAR